MRNGPESIFEDYEVKPVVLVAIEACLEGDVPVASSTLGLLVVSGCERRKRSCLGILDCPRPEYSLTWHVVNSFEGSKRHRHVRAAKGRSGTRDLRPPAVPSQRDDGDAECPRWKSKNPQFF